MAAEKTVKVNYTEDMVKTAKAMYAELGNDGVDAIAAAIHRPRRSVIAKLVREGVYVAAVKAPATAKDEGPTKKELLAALDATGLFDVTGFENATKPAIAAVLAFIESARGDDEDEGDAE